MEVAVYNIKGEDTGRKVVLNDAVFATEASSESNPAHVVYLDVKQYLANQRQGTHKSKERSEVSGSTRKLGRQKGGGGARRGDINSPVLIGGGRVFGPKPRDYRFKLNKNEANENIVRSVRNVPGSFTMLASNLNAYTVLNNDAIVLTEASVETLNSL